MDKLYLLLRNNEQTGPFTIGELLQQHLRPTDMLWIEGRSTAWSYISEMELQPTINKLIEARTETVTDPSKRTIPSPTPAIVKSISNRRYAPDDIESKAEELRKRALNYTPQHLYRAPEKTDEENVTSSSVIPGQEEMIDFVDHREEKKLPAAEIVTGVLITAFIAACIIGGKTLFQQKDIVQPAITTRVLSSDEHTAKTVNKSIVPKDTASLIAQPIIAPVDSLSVVKRHKIKPAIVRDSLVSTGYYDKTSIKETAIKPNNLSTNAQDQVVTNPSTEKNIGDITEDKIDDVKKDVTTQPTKEVKDESTAQTDEKKKGLGQALKNIFRKKKKDE